MPQVPWIVRSGVPAAVSRVAKVWRRSWNRTAPTFAARQAALKRLETFRAVERPAGLGIAKTRSSSALKAVR